MRSIISILALSTFILTSCSKVADETYNISGKVLEDCNGSPAKALELVFSESSANSAWVPPVGAYFETAFTGGDGAFSVELSHNSSSLILIWARQGVDYSVLATLPAGQKAEGLSLVKQPSTKLEIYLNAKDAKTDQDTLTFINPSTMVEERIPGPFSTGLVMEIESYPYKIKENPPQIRMAYTYGPRKTVVAPLELCGITTLTLVVD